MAKILIVDDEPDIELLARQKFRNQVANGDFDLFFATNGREALDLIKQEPGIAVVVSDVNMPEMDGLTLIDNLKELSPQTKTIIVSAYGDTKTLRAAMNKGVFDFVTKPVDFKDLADAISRTISQYRPPTSPLYAYQLLLASSFPERIDLTYPHEETKVLWDAFLLTPSLLIVMGVFLLPSAIPFEISVSTTHGLLKTAISENPDIALSDFQKVLSQLNPLLKAHVFVGQYQMNSHVFSYRTDGGYKGHHITSGTKTLLTPSESALLALGDIISFENISSGSRLSLSRVHKG